MTPDNHTIEEFRLEVGDGHQLYVQTWGNSKGIPVFFLHGGPGSGCKDSHKKFFDPKKHYAVFFDQRGCGKSTPYGSLENNTTDKLAEDINKIADRLGLKKVTLTGGSWGSCLALYYAIKNPERVERLVIRGVFTGRKAEVEFLDKGGFKAFYPDAWEAYEQTVPPEHRADPSAYHHKRIAEGSAEEKLISAHAYGTLEGSIVQLDDRSSLTPVEEYDPAGNIIESFYMYNQCFMEDGYILKNASAITVPVAIVQGRYDMICPPVTAYLLHQALPDSSLIWTQAGHSGSDRSNFEAVRGILANLR